MSRQTSGDLSEGGDLRSEIEENRQYLIRALRAVEATTVECRKEAWNATAKASKLEEAFDAQSETIRDLREQLFASLTQLKDRKIERAPVSTSEEVGLLTERLRQVESEVAQASKSNTSKLKALHHAQKDLNADTAARFQRSETSLDRMLQAFEAQEQRFEELMHSSQVRIDAQITNSDSLTALRLDDMEQRFRKQIAQLQGSENLSQTKPVPVPVLEDPGKLSSIIQRLDQNEKKLNLCLQQLEKSEQEVGRLKTERQMDRDNTAGVLDFESQRIRKQDENIVRMEGSLEELGQGLFSIQAKVQSLQDFGDQLQRSHQAVIASQLEAQPAQTSQTEKLKGQIASLEQRLEEVSAGLDGLGGWMKGSLNEAGMKLDANENGDGFIEIAALKHSMHQLQIDSDRMKKDHDKMLNTVNNICDDMLKLAPREDLRALSDQSAGLLNSVELVRDAVSENSPFATKKTVKNLAAQSAAETKTMIDSLQTQLEELRSAQETMERDLLEFRSTGSFVAQARDDVSVRSNKAEGDLAERLQLVEEGLRATRADVAAGGLKAVPSSGQAKAASGEGVEELQRDLRRLEDKVDGWMGRSVASNKNETGLAERLELVEEGLRATRADVAAGGLRTASSGQAKAANGEGVEELQRDLRKLEDKVDEWVSRSVPSNKVEGDLAERLQLVEEGLRATRADVAAGGLRTASSGQAKAASEGGVEELQRDLRGLEDKVDEWMGRSVASNKNETGLAERLELVEEGLRATRADVTAGGLKAVPSSGQAKAANGEGVEELQRDLRKLEDKVDEWMGRSVPSNKVEGDLAERLQLVEEGLRATRADVAAGGLKAVPSSGQAKAASGEGVEELQRDLRRLEDKVDGWMGRSVASNKNETGLAERLELVEEGLRATRADVAAGGLRTASSGQAKAANGEGLEDLQRDLRKLEDKVEEWVGRHDVLVAQIRSGNLDVSMDQSWSGVDKSTGGGNAANDFMMEEVRRGVRELGRKVQAQEQRQDKVEDEVKELGLKIDLSSEVAQLVDGFDEQRKPVKLTLDRKFEQWNQDLEDELKGTICDVATFLAPWQINIVNLSAGSVVVDFLIRSDRWNEAIAALSQDFGSEKSLLKKRAKAIALIAPEAADRSKIDSMEEEAAEEVGKQIHDQGEKLEALSRLVESMSDGLQIGLTQQVGVEELVNRLEQLEAAFKSAQPDMQSKKGAQSTQQSKKGTQSSKQADVADHSGRVEQQVIRELSGKVEAMEWELRAMRADVGSVQEWKDSVNAVKASAMESSKIVLDLDKKLERLGRVETVLLPAVYKKIEAMEKGKVAKEAKERGFVALMQKEVNELEGKVRGVDVELETVLRSVVDQSAEAEGLEMADLAKEASVGETLKSLERLDKSMRDLEARMSDLDEKTQDQRGAVQQALRDFARRMEVLEAGLRRVEVGLGGGGAETSRSEGDWVTEELHRGVRELGRRMHELATQQDLIGEQVHGVRADLDKGGGELLATKMQLEASMSDVERRLQPLLANSPRPTVSADAESEKLLVRELAGKVEGMEWELRAIRAEVGSAASQSGADKGQPAVAEAARSRSDSDALFNLLSMKVDELTLKQEDVEAAMRIVAGTGGGQWEEENQSWLLELAQRVQALEGHVGIANREEAPASRTGSASGFARSDLSAREELITEIRRLAKELTDKVVVVECELLNVKSELNETHDRSIKDGSELIDRQPGHPSTASVPVNNPLQGRIEVLESALQRRIEVLEDSYRDLKKGGTTSALESALQGRIETLEDSFRGLKKGDATSTLESALQERIEVLEDSFRGLQKGEVAKKGDATSTLDGTTAEQLRGEITSCTIQLRDFEERFALLNALSQSQASLEQAVEELKSGGVAVAVAAGEGEGEVEGLNRRESDSSLDADPWEYATKIDRIEQQLRTLSPLKGAEGLGLVEDIRGLEGRLQALERGQVEIDRKLAALPDRVLSSPAPRTSGISEIVLRSNDPGNASLALDAGQSPTVISSEIGFMRPAPSMLSVNEDPVQQTLFERAAIDDAERHEGSSTASEPEEEEELPQIDLASIHALLASPATMFQDTIPGGGGDASYAGSSAVLGESTSYEIEGRRSLYEDTGVSYQDTGVSYQDSGVSYQDSGVSYQGSGLSYQGSGALEAEATTFSVDPSPARTLGLPSISWSQRAGRSMGRSLQSQGLQSVAEWPLHEDEEKDQMLKTLELLQCNLETRMANLKARAAEELEGGTNTEMDEESSGQLKQLSKDMQDLSRSLQGESLAESAVFAFDREKQDTSWEVNQLTSTVTSSFVNEYPAPAYANVEDAVDAESEFDAFKLETSQERENILHSLETVQSLLAKKAQLLAGKEEASSDGGDSEEDTELRAEIQRLVRELTSKVQAAEGKIRMVRVAGSGLPQGVQTALPEGITTESLMRKVQDHEERLLLLKTLESAQSLLANKLDSLELAQGNTSGAAGGGLGDIQSKLQELLGKVEAQGMKQVSVEGELATLQERMHTSFQASPFHASASGVDGTMSGHRGTGPDATPGFMESFISHVTPDRNRPGTFLDSALTSEIPVARLQDRVLMLERAFHDRDGERFTADGGEGDENDAGVESRLSRLELALIEVLENRSVSIVGDEGIQLSKRLEIAERSVSQILSKQLELEQSLTGTDAGGLEVSSGGTPTKPWVQSHKELMKKVDSLDKKLAIAGPIFGRLGQGSPGDLQDQGSIKATAQGTDVDTSGDGAEGHHKSGIGRRVEEQGMRQMVVEEEIRALRVDMEEVSLSLRSDPRLAVPCVPLSQYQQQLQETRAVLRTLSSGQKGPADAATVDQVRECLESCVTQLLNLSQYIASQDSATEHEREDMHRWRDNVQQLCLSECRSQLSELSDAVSRLWTVVSPRPGGDGSTDGPFATAATVQLMEQGLLSAIDSLNSNFAQLQKEVKEIPEQTATGAKVEETLTAGVGSRQLTDVQEGATTTARPESGLGLPHGESLTTLSGSVQGHGGISEEVCGEICEMRFNELSRPLLSDLEDRIDGACKAAQETAADNEELKQSMQNLTRDMKVLKKQLRATLEGVSLPPSEAGHLSDPELPTTVEAVPTEIATTHTADDLADPSALRDSAQEVRETLSGPMKKVQGDQELRGDTPSVDGTELQDMQQKIKRLEVSVDMLINKFTAQDVAVEQLQRDSEVLSVENAMMQEFQETMRHLEVQGDQLEVKLQEITNRQHDVNEFRKAVQRVEDFEKKFMQIADEEAKSPAKEDGAAEDPTKPREEVQAKQTSSKQTSDTALSERVAAVEGKVAELNNKLVEELEKTAGKLEQSLPAVASMASANEALERRVGNLEEDLSKAITDKAELQEQVQRIVKEEVERADAGGAQGDNEIGGELDAATSKLEASLPSLVDSINQTSAAQDEKLAALEAELRKAVERLEPVEKQTANIDTVVQTLTEQLTTLEKAVEEAKLEGMHVDEGVQTGEETPRTRMVQLEGRLDQHHALLRQLETTGEDLVRREAEKVNKIQGLEESSVAATEKIAQLEARMADPNRVAELESAVSKIAELETGKVDQAKIVELEAAAAEKIAELEARMTDPNRIAELESAVSKIADLETGKADQAKLLELEATVSEHKKKLAEIEEDFEKADEAPWEERLSTLERSALGEQSKQPRIGVLESKIVELDEAMEARENENAELDGRIKDMELQEALTKKRLLRLDSLEGRCDALGDEISTVRLYVDENFVKKQELRPVERQVALLTAHDRVMQQASTLSPVVMAEVTPARDMRSNQERSPGEDGGWTGTDLDSELSIASEGSARIRALAARVRGVTQARTGMPVIPTSPQDGEQESSSQSNSPPSPQISPRSRLEDTAEKIRMWEVRNKDAEDGHDPLSFV